MPEGLRPRGVTPRPRWGAVAESTRLRRRRNGGEELPGDRGRGGRLRGDTPCPRSGAATRGITPRQRSGAAAGRSYSTSLSPRPGAAGGRSYATPPSPRPRVAAWRSNPTPEARGSGREDQTHVQGALAAWAQEGLKELSQVEGQEGRRWGDTPRPR